MDATRVADIATEAGSTHGALYAGFPSKDALAAEAFTHGYAGNVEKIHRRVESRKPGFDAFLTEEMVEILENSLNQEMPIAQRRRLVFSGRSGQIGAIAVSRAPGTF